ncbi:MAG: amylo-alpha-1,6-glucosidase [Deltaproteobacteria bacterium]
MGILDCSQEALLTKEWLVTNGLGGYASGTVAGVITRRYHGLLIADLPAQGRRVMLNHLYEEAVTGGACLSLGGEERSDCGPQKDCCRCSDFRLELGLPVWRYETGRAVIEKRVFCPYKQNTVFVLYRMVAGEVPVELRLRPAINFRRHEEPVDTPLRKDYLLTVTEDRYEVSERAYLPRLRMLLYGRDRAFVCKRLIVDELLYRTEETLGYTSRGGLWSPGYFSASLSPDTPAAFAASTEEWELLLSLKPQDALSAENERRQVLLSIAEAPPDGPLRQLVLAADQFIVTPAGRTQDLARANAYGGEVRTVIAGYHWFTDWGRDTMISLEGLALVTGRHAEAAWILRTFAHHINNGLIPNRFPEGNAQAVYNTADATLWFFHAIERYLAYTGERGLLRFMLPRLLDIVENYTQGTLFNIGVDPHDGLVRQGDRGVALTWMDAKVGEWVVTPRRGKAVEINALWYNALRLLSGWVEEERGRDAAHSLKEQAERCREAFNRRFWYEKGGYLYDIVDGEWGDDTSFRPNQLLAISLTHPVLDRERWESVLEKAEQRLLTPVGLRSLSRESADFKPKYYGDIRSRDAAYHEGTVWAWLIGPFFDAWRKVHGDSDGARFLRGFSSHLDDGCIGSISEIFDAETPFAARGCVAQAWSVAELLRCLSKSDGRAAEKDQYKGAPAD